jgi:uncharacterized membrane protein
MTSQPFFVPAMIIIVAAIPLILGFVPRNRMYGVRTSKTLSEESVWYRSNRFGGWVFILSSVVYLMVAYLCPTLKPRDANFSLWLLHLGAFVLPLIGSVILTLRYARNLRKGENGTSRTS